jgi:hypothetical protein
MLVRSTITLFYHSPEVKIEESSQKSLKRS